MAPTAWHSCVSTRKTGQVSVVAAWGRSAWGHAHKAAPELVTVGFGLYYSTESSNEEKNSYKGTGRGPEESSFYSVK